MIFHAQKEHIIGHHFNKYRKCKYAKTFQEKVNPKSYWCKEIREKVL